MKHHRQDNEDANSECVFADSLNVKINAITQNIKADNF